MSTPISTPSSSPASPTPAQPSSPSLDGVEQDRIPTEEQPTVAGREFEPPGADERGFPGLHANRDPSLTSPHAAAPAEGPADPRRRVEWVRPTDLFARISTRASERGVEWNERAHAWAREQARGGLSAARTQGHKLTQGVGARLSRTGPDSAVDDPVRL